jgi:hypothetical protein
MEDISAQRRYSNKHVFVGIRTARASLRYVELITISALAGLSLKELKSKLVSMLPHVSFSELGTSRLLSGISLAYSCVHYYRVRSISLAIKFRPRTNDSFAQKPFESLC